MKLSLKLLLVASCLPFNVYAFNFSLPFYGKYAVEKVSDKNITIKNDLVDIINFFEIDENSEQLLTKNISAAILKVNNQVIKDGQTTTIPIHDNQYTVTITIRGNSCAPFFQPQGILKLLARFISVNITFTHDYTDSDEEISALLMLTKKLDQWEKHIPHIKVNYQPLLAAHILLTDAQKKDGE